MSKKTLLITGGGGFVASHVIELFLEKSDYRIIAVDSFAHRGDPMRLKHLVHDPRLEILTADLTAPLPKRLVKALGKVDVIINTASESHVDRSITDPVPFVKNNVELQLNVLELARDLAVARFLQCSTDEVYGAAAPGTAHAEWAPILPSNPYSASKAAQDALCISYWRTYQLPLTISMTMNMIGQRQDPEKFIPLVIGKILRGETVKIHGTAEYIGTRTYLHARCLADAWLFLLNQRPEVTSPRYSETGAQRPAVYNVVGAEELDNLTVATMIATAMNKPLRYELMDFHSARPGHDRRYALDGRKLAALGWRHPMSLRDSLEEIIAFYSDPANQYWLGSYQ